MADIGNVVQRHTVGSSPDVSNSGCWIAVSGKSAQLIPAAALFSGTVPGTAQQQKIFIITEGEAAVCLIHVHIFDIAGILESENIGTLLVQFHKIQSVAVSEWKMCGGNDVVRMNDSVGGMGCLVVRIQMQNRGIFVDVQSWKDALHKFQRMKLCLAGKADSTRRPEEEAAYRR